MKTRKNILIAFLLNLGFSIIELFGGIFTGSIAILSDSIHDLGDATSIGVSYFLEKKSDKKPDEKYSYGYKRFSVLGGLITIIILIVGSILVIESAIKRIINPTQINYNGMIILAIAGCILNFLAAFFTKDGDSINQKAVNLHMLEDVLGWVVVLIGAIIMRFTNISIIDPIMSIAVALFILFNAAKELKEILDLFLEKVPEGISIKEVKEEIMEINEIKDVHHIHLWSMDGSNMYATLHAVSDANQEAIKKLIREKLEGLNIHHVTIELEKIGENCTDIECHVDDNHETHHHYHHHH